MTIPDVALTAPITPGSRWRSRGTAGHPKYTVVVERITAGGKVAFRRERHKQGVMSGRINSVTPEIFRAQYVPLSLVASDASAPAVSAPPAPEALSAEERRVTHVAARLLGRETPAPRTQEPGWLSAALTAETPAVPPGPTPDALPVAPDAAAGAGGPAASPARAGRPADDEPAGPESAPTSSPPDGLIPRAVRAAPSPSESGAGESAGAAPESSGTTPSAGEALADAVTAYWDAGAELLARLEASLAPLGASIADRQREIEALEARLVGAVRERDELQRDFDALSGQKEAVERAMEALTREPPARVPAAGGAPQTAPVAAEAGAPDGGGGAGAASRQAWVRSLLVTRGEVVIPAAAPEYAAAFRTSIEEASKALHNTLSGQVRRPGRGWPAIIRPRPSVYRLASADGCEGPGGG